VHRWTKLVGTTCDVSWGSGTFFQHWEFEIYLNNRSNSFVRDGKLFIKPTLTADKFGERFLSTGKLLLYGGSPADALSTSKSSYSTSLRYFLIPFSSPSTPSPKVKVKGKGKVVPVL
jgi:hypothetical protein